MILLFWLSVIDDMKNIPQRNDGDEKQQQKPVENDAKRNWPNCPMQIHTILFHIVPYYTVRKRLLRYASDTHYSYEMREVFMLVA